MAIGFGTSERYAEACELLGATSVSEKAEMAYSAEALGQDVHKKATDELIGIQRHRLGLVLGAIILPAKADTAIATIEKTSVGDGDAMRVATEIVEDLCRTGKGAFGEHDPRRLRERREIFGEGGRIAQPGQRAEKGDAAGVERGSQAFQEKTACAERGGCDDHILSDRRPPRS